MVGAPKNLSDLRRIDAQVRVSCRSCLATEVWELDVLIEEVRRAGGNTDWKMARHCLECPKRCPAPMISLLPIPYGRQRARRRAHRHIPINLALAILREAASRSGTEPVGTIEVRLALHVLRAFGPEQRLLNTYWAAAIVESRHPWTNCKVPYRNIVQRLLDLGASVEDEDRLEPSCRLARARAKCGTCRIGAATGLAPALDAYASMADRPGFEPLSSCRPKGRWSKGVRKPGVDAGVVSDCLRKTRCGVNHLAEQCASLPLRHRAGWTRLAKPRATHPSAVDGSRQRTHSTSRRGLRPTRERREDRSPRRQYLSRPAQ